MMTHAMTRLSKLPLTAVLFSAFLTLSPTIYAEMPVQRAFQANAGGTTTALGNGRTLLTGGVQEGIASPQAWIRSADGKTTPLAGLNTARQYHTTTMLPNGRVLVLGGIDPQGRLIERAEIFDPATGVFTFATGPLPRARAGHTVTVLTDGRLLITGGWHPDLGALYETELFDLPTGKSELLATELQPPRYGHRAALLADGRVLLLGGYDEEGREYSGATLYDPGSIRFIDVDRSIAEQALEVGQQPAIAGTIPLPGSNDLPHDGLIVLRFTTPVDVLADSTITLLGPEGVASLTIVLAEDGRLAFLKAKQDFFPGATYSLFVQGVTDRQGSPLPHFAMSFTTARHQVNTVDARVQIGGAVPIQPTSQVVANTQPWAPDQPITGSVPLFSATPRIVIAQGGVVDGTSSALHQSDTRESMFDSERWRPNASHKGGNWRSGRPLMESLSLRRNEAISDISRTIRITHARLADRAIANTADTGVADTQSTSISGVVMRQNDRPLANVKIWVNSASRPVAYTNQKGEFTLSGVEPGIQEVIVDGRPAGDNVTSYGQFVIGVKVEPKVNNPVAPIYLPKIGKEDWIDLPSPVTEDTIVRTPEVPGMEIHIPKGAILRDREGKIVTKIALIPLPLDRSPFAFPENAPVYVSVQPGGMIVQGLQKGVTPGIRVLYPNQTGAPAGERMFFWSYDPSKANWQIYGEGQISADGAQVVPAPTLALYESVGFMYTTGNPPAPGDAPPPTDGSGNNPGDAGGSGNNPGESDDPPKDSGGGSGNNCDSAQAGDPVDCKTGLFVFERSDIRVRALMPINLTRTYRPGDTLSRAFGLGNNHGYAMYLREVSGTPVRYMQFDLIRADGSALRFYRTSPPGNEIGLIAEHTDSASSYFKTRMAYENGYYVITKKDGTRLVFSLYGTLQWVEDRLGNRVEVSRVGGQISRLTASNGRYVDLSYDSASRITQIKDIAGRTWSYTYSPAGNLIRAAYPDGLAEEYTYDANNRMTTLKNRNGVILVTNQYDVNGRVSQQTMADGGIFNFAYTLDAAGKVTQTDVTDPRGNKRRVTYHPLGYKAAETYAFGTPLAQTTTYERSASNGMLSAIVDPLGRRTEYQRDVLGNISQRTGLAGTANAYTEQFTYSNPYNRLIRYTDPRGKVTTNTYDNRGLLTQVTDPLLHTTTYTYNIAGQVLSISDALGNTTRYDYELSDLRAITDPLGRTTTTFTDLLGRPTVITDPLGRQTRMTYDLMGRVVSIIDPKGQVSSMTYDSNGNRLTFTNPKNQIITWGYDPMNRQISRRDALNQLETFVYDKNGNLTSYTNRRNQIHTSSYDALDRLTQVTHPDSTVTYSYDTVNRVTQITDTAGNTISRAWDSRDRLMTETTPQGTVGYGYDIASRRTALSVSSLSAASYSYDDANRLLSISRDGKTTTFSYDNADRMTQMVMGNGVAKNLTYDAASQLTSIQFTNGPSNLGDLSYTFDDGGQITAINGSLAALSLPAPTTAIAVYDANNRLTSWNGQAISYDAEGNMLTTSGRSYTWDSRNRLTRISGTTTASFSYDGAGRRINKTVPLTSNIATALAYDGANPVLETRGSTITGANLTGLGIDSYLSRRDGATDTYPLTDHLGSTIALTDANGAIVTNYRYEPYGATTRTGAASANPHQYTGRENDGSGLYYYRARYYDPQLMRFISEDPIGLAGGMNSYAYVGGNPISYKDPTGLIFPAAIGAAIAEACAGGGCAALEALAAALIRRAVAQAFMNAMNTNSSDGSASDEQCSAKGTGTRNASPPGDNDEEDKQKKGRPRDPGKQNQQVRDAANAERLNGDQRRALGRAVEAESRRYGETPGYQDIRDIARQIKKGSYY